MKRDCRGGEPTRRNHRLHYCGTCKTIGARYGQRSRMTLNHDAVFLSELLSLFADEQTAAWQSAYQSRNCMSMPEAAEQPFSLRYAAAATVFLADAKLADHQQDSPHWRWTWLRRFFDKSVHLAEQDLAAWGVPLERVRALLAAQKSREEHSGTDPRYCAEPTAEVTALFFAHGAPTAFQEMLDLGHAFGTLIYLLDAWEDRARDAAAGEFNALTALYRGDATQMQALLQQVQAETEAALDRLPLAASVRERFLLRLRSNVSQRMHPGLPVLHSCAAHSRRSWKEAKALAAALRERWRESGDSLLSSPRLRWLAPAILLPVVAIAWLAPEHAKDTHSYRECLGLSANLMALAAAAPPPLAGKGRKGSGGTTWCAACSDGCSCACCACECCECCEACGSCA